LSIASQVAVMDGGRLVQIGTPAEIYEQPNSCFVADFVGEVDLFEGGLTAGPNCLALKVAGFDRPIPLPSGTALPHGTKATLALRPEKLRLWHEPPAEFAIPATVSSVGYFCGVSVVHLVVQI
jgi:putrescine transport system ATP-binding protein